MDAQVVQEAVQMQLDPSQINPAVQVIQLVEFGQFTQSRGHAIQVLFPDKEKPGSQLAQVVIKAWLQVAQLAITKLQATQLSPALFKYVVEALGHKQSFPDA